MGARGKPFNSAAAYGRRQAALQEMQEYLRGSSQEALADSSRTAFLVRGIALADARQNGSLAAAIGKELARPVCCRCGQRADEVFDDLCWPCLDALTRPSGVR